MKTTGILLTVALIGLAGCSSERPIASIVPEPAVVTAAPIAPSVTAQVVRPTRKRSLPTTPVAPATDALSDTDEAAITTAAASPMPDLAVPSEQAVGPSVPVADAPSSFPSPDAPATVTPARLVGLDPIETTRLLGRPVETAEAPPALRWSWRAERCTLQLFFFMDLKTRDFRALSFPTSGYDDANDADLRCLADVVAQAGSDERR